MEQFSQYGHAIVAMAGIALFGLVMSPLSAMKKKKLGLAPGSTPEADYGTAVYRWHRAYLNLTESMTYFIGVLVAAMLAGVSPFWVNLLASLYLVSRVVLAVVHVQGIGKPDMSVRSFVYLAGWLICVILALMAIVGSFS